MLSKEVWTCLSRADQHKKFPENPTITKVALLGHDYPTMKPRMHVKVGDTVKRGQLLFEDRKSEGVHFTAPGAGEIVAIHRGDKRAFQSLVIALNESGEAQAADQVSLKLISPKMLRT